MGDVGEDASQKKQVMDAKNAIIGFNNTFFKVKLQLMKMELANGLSQAISELIANIKKIIADIKPTLTVHHHHSLKHTETLTVQDTVHRSLSSLLDLLHVSYASFTDQL